MDESNKKIISLKELYELIDLYKYGSIVGERVELIVKPDYKDGKYDNSKRVITIGLQGGLSRDRDTFIVDYEDFDRLILPQLINYYTYYDLPNSWDVNLSELDDTTNKGVCETQNGNLIYLESLNKDIYDELDILKEESVDNVTYKNSELTNEDKIWDEILLYAKNRRFNLDFYKGNTFSEDEVNEINKFIDNLINSNKEISISNSRKSKKNNENIIKNIIEDKYKAMELGLSESLINKIVNTSVVNKLSVLTASEKRLSKRLDINDSYIKDKIKFATEELDKVNYFELRNANFNQFKNNDYVTSKPKAIIDLKNIYSNEDLYDGVTRNKYNNYCDSILEYLDRKSKDNNKEAENKNQVKEASFEEYKDLIVDSYEELFETIDLMNNARINDEHFEVIIKPLDEDENKRYVRLSLTNSYSRDSFEFVFNDKDLFDEKLPIIKEKISEDDENILIDNNLDIIKNNDEKEINQKSNADDTEEELEIIDIEEDEKETENDLNILNEFINNYMKEQEKDNISIKNNNNIEIPFIDISIFSYELLVNKYKDKLDDMYINNLLTNEEKEIVTKFKNYKEKLIIYYNETCNRAGSLIQEEIKRLADSEVALKLIYQLENKFNDEINSIINKLNDRELTSSNKLLLRSLKEMKNSDIKENKLLDDLIIKNIDNYSKVCEKYNGDLTSVVDTQELNVDKKTINDLMDYKFKLMDTYNNILYKDDISQDESKIVARYENYLKKIFEIESKYVVDLEDSIEKLEKNEEFLTPSSKIWLNSLNKEYNRQNGYLFNVIEKNESKDINNHSDIKDAFEKALSYKNDKDSLDICINFDKEDKSNAELVIYNMENDQKIITYERTIETEVLKNEIIPILCNLFSINNELEYNINYKIANSEDYCLVAKGDNSTFKIKYGEENLINNTKELLDKCFSNENNNENKLNK